MSRYPEVAEDYLIMQPSIRRSSGSDLMPVARFNNFKRWNSCLQHVESQPEDIREWDPPPPSSHCPQIYHKSQYSRRERSPDILTDDRGRPIPRRGMFLNAKYSEAARPPIDEDRIRHTEDVIKRMLYKGRRKESMGYYPNRNHLMRDQIRQTVYNLGVPNGYRAPEQDHFEDDYDDQPGPSNRHYGVSSHPEYYREDRWRLAEGDYEVDKGDGSRQLNKEKYLKKRRKQMIERESVDSEISEEEEEEEIYNKQTKRRRSQKTPIQHNKNRTESRLHQKEKSSSDEEVHEKSTSSRHSNVSRSSKSPYLNDDRAPSRGSKCTSSHHSTPKLLTPSPQYLKDSDDDDNWKNSIPFMSSSDGAGAGMRVRIGSAIASLPLRDDSKNSYSEVALMLLERSVKNLKNPQKMLIKEKPQTRIMNMSTSWAQQDPKKRNENDDDEIVPETEKAETSLMHDLSRIQHPQNATTVQMDQTLFTNSKLMKIDVAIAKNWLDTKMKKTLIPPPLFRSSPISEDVFKSSDRITMPSTIKGPESTAVGNRISSDGEEEDFATKQFDIDDYIARGASKIDFSKTITAPNTSFQEPSTSLFKDPTFFRQESKGNEMNIESFSERTPSKNRTSQQMEFQISTSSISKTKTNASLDSIHRRKSKPQPMLEFDAETQKMFDDAFQSDKKSTKEKYPF